MKNEPPIIPTVKIPSFRKNSTFSCPNQPPFLQETPKIPQVSQPDNFDCPITIEDKPIDSENDSSFTMKEEATRINLPHIAMEEYRLEQ